MEKQASRSEKSANRRELKGFWKGVFLCFSACGMALAINQLFFLMNRFGFSLFQLSYYYAIYAAFLSPVFLLIPASKKCRRDLVPWYDVLLFLATFGICLYYSIHGLTMFVEGWMFALPRIPTILGMILCFVVLEACRRAGGFVLFVLVLFFFFFPMFASHIPSPMTGFPFSFWQTMGMQSMGSDSLAGLAIWTFATLLIGFMIFGVVMTATGGGRFFIDLALGLMGHTRGGPAKVAIVASGLFGSLSGSVIANVLTSGVMTIPAMKKAGYSAHYAAAVETNASTGGVLLPPVMGSIAFVMAMWLGIPYLAVCAAAAIPALLYYFALMVQVDIYAVRKGLKGLSRAELPSLLATLKEGWFYVFAFLLLIYFLAVLRLEGQAPFYAAAALLVIAMIKRSSRLHAGDFISMIMSAGDILVPLAAIFAGISLIIGSLIMTGVSSALASEVMILVGGNAFLALAISALVALILGTGMQGLAVYIFLALVLAPALEGLGFNIIAVHLFIMYYAVLGFITPPVCMGAFVAAGVAGAPSMKTGFYAMRLGTITYFLPFFFILNPALIAQTGSAAAILSAVGTCMLGIILVSGALEGYLWWIGNMGWVVRFFSLISGVLLAVPEMKTNIYGGIIALVALGTYSIVTKAKARKLSTGQERS
jgi:TRAP transporter 4TM/12TM fusion protein